MKNLIAKLKGQNYKQLAVDHFEKMILGMIGLFVLICLAGTSWSRYDKQPEEFLKKVEQGENAIKSSSWAGREAEFKSSRDIMQAVEMLHSSLDTSRYVYSTNWYWPMYATALKVSEPKWLAPIQPIADFGKVVTVENPVDPLQGQQLAVMDDEPAKKKEKEEEDEFAVRTAATNNAPGGAIGGAAVPMPVGAPIAAPGGAAVNPYQKMLSSTTGMGTEMPGQSGPTIKSLGLRFIAIRSVFPLGDQLDELVKAMHENKQKAAELIDFMDFEVERQVALPGDKPWSGKWEKVDLQATLDLLERVDYDTEVVDLAYTDAVFTMPLLRRVTGNWKKWASHPLIKAMSDEQVELQAQLTQRMVEEAEAMKKDEPGKKKGLSRSQVDARSLRGQFTGNQMMGMMKDVTSQMGAGKAMPYTSAYNTESMRQMADPASGMMGGFQDQMTRNNGRMSKYLLLRYFDFQVTPGNAYRYQMRVTLRNPNYKRPVEELVQEETALDEVRVSPWSEPTPPVYVRNEEKVFLAKADKAKIETGLPMAYLDVYQWFSEAGTTIVAKLEKLQLGQFVGGRPPKTEVFRPASYTLRDEEIPVFTGSVLADVAAASIGDLELAEHLDLKVDSKKLKQLGVVDKALLVDRFGQLVALDPKASSSIDELAQAQDDVDRERRAIRAYKKDHADVASTTSDLDKLRRPGAEAGGAAMPGGYDQMMAMQQPGMGSPLKKGGAKGAGKKAPPKKSGGANVKPGA